MVTRYALEPETQSKFCDQVSPGPQLVNIPLNRNTPAIMHVDINSCFATCEQQANPFLRGKPVVIAAYSSPNGCIVSPSIEAKQLGVKVGMPVRSARLLCPNVIVKTPSPPLYRDVHIKFAQLLKEYSPVVVTKSIDEAVIDFTDIPYQKRGLVTIGQEIKKRIKQEIGEWVRCNIGIGTNRFLAKTAAGLHKPDGLDVITHENLKEVYNQLKLTDLCGINERYQARLNINGIYTPLQFLCAPEWKLCRSVFQSIVGHYWYLRLRGYEVDEVDFARKSFGQMYSLQKATSNAEELSKIVMKLCEKMGRRLRRAGFAARGLHVACVYQDYTHWHQSCTFSTEQYTTPELYRKAQIVLNKQPAQKVITKLGVSCYNLVETSSSQPDLFEGAAERQRAVYQAVDAINDKYGEFVITPAIMMGMKDVVIDRISFGGVKELEDW